MGIQRKVSHSNEIQKVCATNYVAGFAGAKLQWTRGTGTGETDTCLSRRMYKHEQTCIVLI